ncbi:MAG: TolC family protein [Holophagales bacterium]|nr:TolC family protein [Holophagales bacterium]
MSALPIAPSRDSHRGLPIAGLLASALAFLWMPGPPAASACELHGQELLLEQAILCALEGNRRLAASEARSEAAAAHLETATAGRLPRASLGLSIRETDDPTLVFSHKLAQGIFTEADFAIDRLQDPGSLSHWQIGLRLEQPVWTGGRLRHGIAAAEAGLGAAEAEHRSGRQQVAHAVIHAFTRAILAGRQEAAARASLTTASANLELVRDLHRAGLVVASDALAAEVREGEVREMLIRAESGHQVARATLNRVLGRPLGSPLHLPESIEGTAVLTTLREGELPDLLDRALRRRPDLEAARLGARVAAEGEKLERAERRPQLGLEAFHETAAGDFFGTDGTSFGVTLQLGWKLFDPGQGSREAAAEAAHRESRARLEDLEQTADLEVRRAHHELRAARQRLAQTSTAVDLAKRSLDIVRDRYQNGLAILPELLDTETALTRGRARRLAAERDWHLARATLALATGDLDPAELSIPDAEGVRRADEPATSATLAARAAPETKLPSMAGALPAVPASRLTDPSRPPSELRHRRDRESLGPIHRKKKQP